MALKRYLLFAGNEYYPNGGAYDYIESFDTVEAAINTYDPKEREWDWANVLDAETGDVVKHLWFGSWTDEEPQ